MQSSEKHKVRAVGSKFNLAAYDGRNCDQMAAQVATGGGCRRGMCPLAHGAWKLQCIDQHALENAKISPYTKIKVLIAHAQ